MQFLIIINSRFDNPVAIGFFRWFEKCFLDKDVTALAVHSFFSWGWTAACCRLGLSRLSLHVGTIISGFCTFIGGSDSIIEYARSLWMDWISSPVGLFVNDKILYNWFNVDVPGNIGFPKISSPIIQPRLHISTPFV